MTRLRRLNRKCEMSSSPLRINNSCGLFDFCDGKHCGVIALLCLRSQAENSVSVFPDYQPELGREHDVEDKIDRAVTDKQERHCKYWMWMILITKPHTYLHLCRLCCKSSSRYIYQIACKCWLSWSQWYPRELWQDSGSWKWWRRRQQQGECIPCSGGLAIETLSLPTSTVECYWSWGWW